MIYQLKKQIRTVKNKNHFKKYKILIAKFYKHNNLFKSIKIIYKNKNHQINLFNSKQNLIKIILKMEIIKKIKKIIKSFKIKI